MGAEGVVCTFTKHKPGLLKMGANIMELNTVFYSFMGGGGHEKLSGFPALCFQGLFKQYVVCAAVGLRCFAVEALGGICKLNFFL